MSDSLFPDLFSAFDAPASPPRPTRDAASSPASAKKISEEQLLEGLNAPQRAAVVHAGAPVLVVAELGREDARPHRIAHLVSQRNVHPGSILAITFTNKAAAEMRSRVIDLVGNRAKLMWCRRSTRPACASCVTTSTSSVCRNGSASTTTPTPNAS